MTSPSPRRALALALGLLLPVPLAGQSVDAKIDSMFSYAGTSTPGCAVAAARDGAVLFAKGYGMADLEHGVPITPTTPFYLASVSKQFTAAAINLLALDGKLSLDDDVRKHVSEFPSYGAPITLRHLIHHTSGLRDYLSLFFLAGVGDLAISNADFLAMLGRQQGLNFPTGERYSYSNSNYVLLSIVVQRVSGKSLRAFATERIFEPLGMTATVFRDHNAMLIPGRALAYFREGQGRWAHSVPNFHTVGDGGLFSSVVDLVKWEGNFWQPKVGGAEWLRLSDARGKLNDGRGISYGAGLVHEAYRGDSVVQHGGSFGGYNTALMRFPKRHFSVAVLCNAFTTSPGTLAQRIADLFLGDSLAAVSATAPAANAGSAGAGVPADLEALSKLTGTYFSEPTVLLRRVVVDSGRLFYRRGPGNQSELRRVDGLRFEMLNVPVALTVTFSARGDTLVVHQAGELPTVLLKVKDRGLAPAASFAGTYQSSELGTSYVVTAVDSTLSIRPERGSGQRLLPAFADAFGGDNLFARFLRDAKGKVVGMDLSSGERVRHLTLQKRD